MCPIKGYILSKLLFLETERNMMHLMCSTTNEFVAQVALHKENTESIDS